MIQTQDSVRTDRDGHVLIITINRPDARNAIDQATHIGIGEALEAAEADPEVRVVVITGAGDQAFCAGADLKALSRGEKIMPDDSVQRAWGFAGYVKHIIGKPTIAAVNGAALGGGTEIVLASDLAVAVETASLGLPEVRRGIVAAAGGAFRLPAQIAPKLAMELMLTGDAITAARALELGLINAVAPTGQLMTVALDLAYRIAANAPLAVQATKRIARGVIDDVIEGEAAAWEQSQGEAVAIMQSQDAREGPRAFAEKRAPIWKAK